MMCYGKAGHMQNRGNKKRHKTKHVDNPAAGFAAEPNQVVVVTEVLTVVG